MQKQTSAARSTSTKQGTSDPGQEEHSVLAPHSLLQHASFALKAAKQSASRLSQHIWLDSSPPFKTLAASWLLTNVALPLLFISHPLARSTLVHAFAAVGGSVVLYHVLGPGPFLYTSFLSLLPLLLPHTPAAFVEVEGRTVVLLPPVLFPRLLPLWRQLQLVVNTLVVAAVVEHVRQHVRAGRKRAECSSETSVELNVPVAGRDLKEGEWELGVTLTVRTTCRREDDMETEGQSAADGTEEKQREQHQQQASEWSPEEKREREEAEYPRAPPSSPADFSMKMKVTTREGAGGSQKQTEYQAAEESRGEFQSPKPQGGAVAGLDVAGLRKVLDPLAAEHECFKPSTESISAPHGDPVLSAERRQQAGSEQQIRGEKSK